MGFFCFVSSSKEGKRHTASFQEGVVVGDEDVPKQALMHGRQLPKHNFLRAVVTESKESIEARNAEFATSPFAIFLSGGRRWRFNGFIGLGLGLALVGRYARNEGTEHPRMTSQSKLGDLQEYLGWFVGAQRLEDISQMFTFEPSDRHLIVGETTCSELRVRLRRVCSGHNGEDDCALGLAIQYLLVKDLKHFMKHTVGFGPRAVNQVLCLIEVQHHQLVMLSLL